MSVSAARSSLLKTLHMDAEGLLPACIRDRMLSVPCRRMLREVHGGKWRAIWYWVWSDVKTGWMLFRMRFYLTKEEREHE